MKGIDESPRRCACCGRSIESGASAEIVTPSGEAVFACDDVMCFRDALIGALRSNGTLASGKLSGLGDPTRTIH